MSQRSKYAELAFTLKALEDKIFFHAAHKQSETVQSFLNVAIRKAKLDNELSLIAGWDDIDILKKRITIVLCAQNEIPNIEHVERAYIGLSALKFKYLRFLKFIEYHGDFKSDESKLDNLETTITSETSTVKTTTIKVKDLKFHVARYGTDEYGRSIKLGVYTNEVIDTLLKPSAEEDHWIPNADLFYLLDLVFGEYYMTKYISTINFYPSMIMPADTNFLTATEAKENIDILLKLDVKRCTSCNLPEYRIKIGEKSLCSNCVSP
jgi:hypothetical protein